MTKQANIKYTAETKDFVSELDKARLALNNFNATVSVVKSNMANMKFESGVKDVIKGVTEAMKAELKLQTELAKNKYKEDELARKQAGKIELETIKQTGQLNLAEKKALNERLTQADKEAARVRLEVIKQEGQLKREQEKNTNSQILIDKMNAVKQQEIIEKSKVQLAAITSKQELEAAKQAEAAKRTEAKITTATIMAEKKAAIAAENNLAKERIAMIRNEGQNHRQEMALTQKAMQKNTQEVILSWKSIERIMFAHTVRRIFMSLISAVKTAVREVQEFHKAITYIETIASVSSRTFNAWNDSLLRVSNTWGVTLKDAAAGYYQTISNQITKSIGETEAFSNSVFEFARITGADAVTAVNLVTGSLNAYNRQAIEAEQSAANLFKAFELGRIKASELGDSYGRVAVVAAQLGIAEEHLLGSLSRITIQGVKSNEAMTLFRGILMKMIRPTEEMKNLFAEVGVTSGENMIQIYGFAGALKILYERTKGTGSEIADLFTMIRPTIGMTALLSDLEKTMATFDQFGEKALDSYRKAQEMQFQSPGEQLNRHLNAIKNTFTSEYGNNIARVLVTIGEKMMGVSTKAKDGSVQLNGLSKLVMTLAKSLTVLGGVLATVFITNRIVQPFRDWRLEILKVKAATDAQTKAMLALNAASMGSKILTTFGSMAALIAISVIVHKITKKWLEQKAAIESVNQAYAAMRAKIESKEVANRKTLVETMVGNIKEAQKTIADLMALFSKAQSAYMKVYSEVEKIYDKTASDYVKNVQESLSLMQGMADSILARISEIGAEMKSIEDWNKGIRTSLNQSTFRKYLDIQEEPRDKLKILDNKAAALQIENQNAELGRQKEIVNEIRDIEDEKFQIRQSIHSGYASESKRLQEELDKTIAEFNTAKNSKDFDEFGQDVKNMRERILFLRNEINDIFREKAVFEPTINYQAWVTAANNIDAMANKITANEKLRLETELQNKLNQLNVITEEYKKLMGNVAESVADKFNSLSFETMEQKIQNLLTMPGKFQDLIKDISEQTIKFNAFDTKKNGISETMEAIDLMVSKLKSAQEAMTALSEATTKFGEENVKQKQQEANAVTLSNEILDEVKKGYGVIPDYAKRSVDSDVLGWMTRIEESSRSKQRLYALKEINELLQEQYDKLQQLKNQEDPYKTRILGLTGRDTQEDYDKARSWDLSQNSEKMSKISKYMQNLQARITDLEAEVNLSENLKEAIKASEPVIAAKQNAANVESQKFKEAAVNFEFLKDMAKGVDDIINNAALTSKEKSALLTNYADSLKGLNDSVGDGTMSDEINNLSTSLETLGTSVGNALTDINKALESIGDVRTPEGNYKGKVKYLRSGWVSRGLDTVPAMLTPGEAVINRDATRKLFSQLVPLNNNNRMPTAVNQSNVNVGGVNVNLSNHYTGMATAKDISNAIGTEIRRGTWR